MEYENQLTTGCAGGLRVREWARSYYYHYLSTRALPYSKAHARLRACACDGCFFVHVLSYYEW